MNDQLTDYIVIGSGFGGSVSAMRLAEKGYSVAVLEKGKRFGSEDFPKTNWDVRRFLWAPVLRCFGFQDLTFFKEVFVLHGAGVGGGSLVYANTHMVPPDAFFQDPAWAHLRDWKKTLTPFYEKAKFMLGSVRYDKLNPEDRLLKEVARDMNREGSFGPVNVGIYFGDTEKAKDPYFNGLGPERKGCIECAGCMVGCRHNAKNTLDKNYLFFAEKFGAVIHPETLVTKVEYKDGIYHVHTRSSTALLGGEEKIYRSRGVVFSAGVLGTLKLLFQQKFEHQTLTRLSDRLGENLRTNSESLCGITGEGQKLNNGVAITSIFNPDDHTHIEIVKYPNGSGAMGKLATMATGAGSPMLRTLKLLANIATRPVSFLKTFFHRRWAENTIIFLVMQNIDNSLKMRWTKGIFGPTMKMDNSGNKQIPAYIPIGQEVMYRYAEKVPGAVAQNVIPEILFNTSTTAHILGGCPMGETPDQGVVNERFEAHGYPNMYILDGSIIPCNLGVNPSLTITSLSEYAMSLIPVKPGHQRPSLDEQMAARQAVTA